MQNIKASIYSFFPPVKAKSNKAIKARQKRIKVKIAKALFISSPSSVYKIIKIAHKVKVFNHFHCSLKLQSRSSIYTS